MLCTLVYFLVAEDRGLMRNGSKRSYKVLAWPHIAYFVRDSLATGWTVRGSNLGRGEIFRTHSDRPRGPPSLLYNGYRVIPKGKSAGAWR